ncbi:hypothetical protein P154DRAFT_573147 [Amniculicola lignicola CBS 123094]|uniref:Uncharacterized protein n=1 Tax=Amniculicola lignicola CBS 123094 TaxID=1392246 RepID=A0A6A5WPT0_9PLEO|nr:hypothetical protein P154DRAFT_573147 [Amniculicola lignicola CBS 123094]
MKSKSIALGIITAYATAALAVRQDETPRYPIGNSTAKTISPTAPCDSHCSVAYPERSAVRWIPESDIVYTTEVVVATVTSIFVTSANVTLEPEVYTVYNTDAATSSIGAEYSLYFRDSNLAGTAIVTIAFPQADAQITFYSTLTYPTSYVDYSTEYHWDGVLPTHDKAKQPVCATASPAPDNVVLALHPDYPQPTAAPASSRANSTGNEYIPLWVSVEDQPDTRFFRNAFPSESAFFLCEPSSLTRSPSPTRYSAPRYITDTTTIYRGRQTDAFVHIESSATGWEVATTTEPTFGSPIIESSVSGFESEPPDSGVDATDGGGGAPPAHTTLSIQAPKVHVESSVTEFGATPIAGETHGSAATSAGINTSPVPDLPGLIVSLIYNNPGLFSSAQQATTKITNPTPAAAEFPQNIAPTPVFTLVPTVVNGQSTTIPAYLLPDSSSTATIGQEVTINGQITVLAAPSALLFTSIPITINGVVTYSPAYIISGTSTASLGQTIIMDVATTALAAPGAIFTTVPTTISGTSTNIPAYLIGSSTATIGQTVVLGGQTTVRSTGPPILKFTLITTTVSGKETTFASYVEDTTAGGGGRTEVVGGTTTVLALPSTTGTGSPASSRTSGGSSATSSGPAPATSTPGAAGRTAMSWGLLGFVGLGLVSVLML